jgi:uncharacterized UBP type Zn finger protein
LKCSTSGLLNGIGGDKSAAICYGNATIQLLVNLITPYQVKHLIGKECQQSIFNTLYKLMVSMRCLEPGLSAGPLVAQVWNFGHKKYIYGAQEDAHEFLTLLLAALSISSFKVTQCSWVKCMTCKHDMYEDEDEKLRDLRLTVTNNIITLDLGSSSKRQSLIELINKQFVHEEVDFKCYHNLPGGCAYISSQRKQSIPKKKPLKKKPLFYKERRATKQIRLLSVSDFVIFTLKRYHIEKHIRKNCTPVEFPPHIKLETYTDDNHSTPVQRSLVGIICHDGSSLSCGHYVAYIYNPITSNWLKYDDEHVESCNIFTVIREVNNVYLLVYGPDRSTGMRRTSYNFFLTSFNVS